MHLVLVMTERDTAFGLRVVHEADSAVGRFRRIHGERKGLADARHMVSRRLDAL